MALGWIYVVKDSNGRPVYVGQTRLGPVQRYKQHLRDAATSPKTRFHLWLKEQIDNGFVPMLSTIESAPIDMLDKKERHWMDTLAAESDLLNDRAPDPDREVRRGAACPVPRRDLFLMSSAADVDPRTFAAYLSGANVKKAKRAAIEKALRRHGRADLVRACDTAATEAA